MQGPHRSEPYLFQVVHAEGLVSEVHRLQRSHAVLDLSRFHEVVAHARERAG